jgi:hypothetical protein
MLKDNNRKEDIGAKYENDLTEKQIRTNIYANGFEDGTDNFYNAICAKFKIKRD